MDTRLRVHGHSIQPMLVTFPLGLFVCAAVFDVADVVGGPRLFGEVGYWTAIAGLVAAALAGAGGLVDLWDTRTGPTRRTMVIFNAINLAMTAIFMLACLVRAHDPQRGATGALVAAELLALAVGAVGVRLGAVLVQQFEVGHYDEAVNHRPMAATTGPGALRRSL